MVVATLQTSDAYDLVRDAGDLPSPPRSWKTERDQGIAVSVPPAWLVWPPSSPTGGPGNFGPGSVVLSPIGISQADLIPPPFRPLPASQGVGIDAGGFPTVGAGTLLREGGLTLHLAVGDTTPGDIEIRTKTGGQSVHIELQIGANPVITAEVLASIRHSPAGE